MKTVLISAMLLACTAPALAELPDDVIDYMSQREMCDQLRAEDDTDNPAARSERDVNYAAFCRGTDKQLAELRARYSNNAEVLDALVNYDDVIETQTPKINGQ